MIEITYRHHGQRPSTTTAVRDDARKASTLPPSFEVVGVRYIGPKLVLRVDPPSDSISQDSVDAIATAFEDNWGGTIDHVDTTVMA